MVNLTDGTRLGTIANSDLIFDGKTGQIESIVLPNKGSLLNFFGCRHQFVIPWDSVKKIGAEVIIVEIENSRSQIMKNPY